MSSNPLEDLLLRAGLSNTQAKILSAVIFLVCMFALIGMFMEVP